MLWLLKRFWPQLLFELLPVLLGHLHLLVCPLALGGPVDLGGLLDRECREYREFRECLALLAGPRVRWGLLRRCRLSRQQGLVGLWDLLGLLGQWVLLGLEDLSDQERRLLRYYPRLSELC